jgi:hypothetical protein
MTPQPSVTSVVSPAECSFIRSGFSPSFSGCGRLRKTRGRQERPERVLNRFTVRLSRALIQNRVFRSL